ncbi:FtsH protease activity modulator HflK [Elusimicrobiota bacterium]
MSKFDDEAQDNYDSPVNDLLKQVMGGGYKGNKLPKGIFSYIFGGLALALVASTSYYTVQPQEEAVILRFGRYVSTASPGLHFKLPFGIDRAIKVKTKVILQEEFGFRSSGSKRSQSSYGSEVFEKESLTLTGDLNVADVEWIVQYQISEPQKYLFNVRDVLKNIRDVSQSMMRRVVGDRLVSDVLTVGRIEIATEAQVLTQEVLDRYDMGIRIVAVKLQDVNPPEQVKPAFNEVNAAKQEQEKVINQAEEYYNKIIPEARGKAEQAIQDAEGYASALINTAKGDAQRFDDMRKAYQKSPQITRTRLYLETMEELYSRFQELTIVDAGVKGILPVFTAPAGTRSRSAEPKGKK